MGIYRWEYTRIDINGVKYTEGHTRGYIHGRIYTEEHTLREVSEEPTGREVKGKTDREGNTGYTRRNRQGGTDPGEQAQGNSLRGTDKEGHTERDKRGKNYTEQQTRRDRQGRE